MICLEQALKQNRKSWKIWENYLLMSMETLNFPKAVQASREIIRQGMIERLTPQHMLKLCDVFLKVYVVKVQPKEGETAEEDDQKKFTENYASGKR